MRSAKRLAAGFLAVALAPTLSACGGAGGSSSTTGSSATQAVPTSTPTTNAVKAHMPKSSSRKPPRRRESTRDAPELEKKAGQAAPFLVPRGDNSVPTFGTEASASQRAGAEAILRSFLEARARRDWATACRYLAPSTRSRLEQFAESSGGKPKGCGPVLKMLAGSGPPSSLADPLTQGLLSLRVKGATAFALWVGPHSQKYAMPMASEGGAWRITQIAPLPYPPGSSSAP